MDMTIPCPGCGHVEHSGWCHCGCLDDREHKNPVHCKRRSFDVYIGRPSKWGNPYVVGRDGTREEVIQKYESWIKTQPDLMAALPEIKGKVLGCWCSPQPCHGSVLIRLTEEL